MQLLPAQPMAKKSIKGDVARGSSSSSGGGGGGGGGGGSGSGGGSSGVGAGVAWVRFVAVSSDGNVALWNVQIPMSLGNTVVLPKPPQRLGFIRDAGRAEMFNAVVSYDPMEDRVVAFTVSRAVALKTHTHTHTCVCVDGRQGFWK